MLIFLPSYWPKLGFSEYHTIQYHPTYGHPEPVYGLPPVAPYPDQKPIPEVEITTTTTPAPETTTVTQEPPTYGLPAEFYGPPFVGQRTFFPYL